MNRWVGVLAWLVTRHPRLAAVIQALVTPACRAGRCQQPPGGPWISRRLIEAWYPPGPGRALPGPGTGMAQDADRGTARPLARLAAGGWGCRTLMPGLQARSVINVAIWRRR